MEEEGEFVTTKKEAMWVITWPGFSNQNVTGISARDGVWIRRYVLIDHGIFKMSAPVFFS
jgi:hypothetical protein